MNIKKLFFAVYVVLMSSFLLVDVACAEEYHAKRAATGSRGRTTGSYRQRRAAAGRPRGKNMKKRAASTREEISEEEAVIVAGLGLQSEDFDAIKKTLTLQGDKKPDAFEAAVESTGAAVDVLSGAAVSREATQWEEVNKAFKAMQKAWNSYQPTFKTGSSVKHDRYDRAEHMKKIADAGMAIATKMQSYLKNKASLSDVRSAFIDYKGLWEKREGDMLTPEWSTAMNIAYAKSQAALTAFEDAQPQASAAAEAEESEESEE